MRRGLGCVLVLGMGALGLAASCATSYGDATPPPDAGDADSAAADGASGMTPADATAEAPSLDASDTDFASALIRVTGGTVFAIEATEVTVAQFNSFKTRLQGTPDFPEDKCPGKSVLGPTAPESCPARFEDDDPITCIDWCDADAYCKAIGRHLCGAKTGATLAEANLNDPSVDAWYFACSGPTSLTYPYGAAAEAAFCATTESSPSHVVNVASMPNCQGAEQGLFDMSGNAAEWIDSCEGANCVVRGGSYEDTAGNATCSIRISVNASSALADVGFRCCAEP